MKKFMAWVLGTVITLLFCVPASFAMYIAMGTGAYYTLTGR